MSVAAAATEGEVEDVVGRNVAAEEKPERRRERRTRRQRVLRVRCPGGDGRQDFAETGRRGGESDQPEAGCGCVQDGPTGFYTGN